MRTLVRLSVVIAAIVCFALPGRAGAVVGGTDDTSNQFQSVGSLQLLFDGEWYEFCSGTLVAQDVVLTSAHCVDFFTAAIGDPAGFGTDDIRVTFDPTPDETSTYYSVAGLAIHPDWLARDIPQPSNSKYNYLKPGSEDIALVFLTEEVAGVQPSPIADADYFDGIDLTAETFTVVGYGTDAYITGSAAAPRPIVAFDGDRTYRDVTVITEHDLFPDRFFKITAGVCFGDSGGPMFHEGTVVALNAWTFSYRCSGPNLEYRLDSEPAQEFLAEYGL